MIEAITSAKNPRILRIAQLNAKSKERRDNGIFPAEGLRLFREIPPMLRKEVYISERFRNEHPSELIEIETSMEQNGKAVFLLEDRLFQKISDTKHPQGILCIARMPAWTEEALLGRTEGLKDAESFKGAKDLKDTGSIKGAKTIQKRNTTCPKTEKQPLILVLEGLQDPGNVGTLIRTAEAAGATGILMTGHCVDVYSPKVIRSTMGGIFRMPMLFLDTAEQAIGWLRRHGIRSFAAHLSGENAFTDEDYRIPAAFLIGNEGNGLSEELTMAADTKILIPMEGRIESLNAAVAGSLLLYEAHRQRR